MRQVLILFLIIFSAGAFAGPSKNVIFWLSVDGFSPSYLEKAKTPRLHELMKNSIYTKKLTPIFPSITFPSHCSQATGVRVKGHGIPLNTFYDTATGKVESYPSDSSLLTAEPIWQTAKRAGLRSAVFNWPLSFKQTGKYQSDYYNEAYENELTDEERVNRALAIWDKDRSEGKKLNLIMAYIVGPDSIGHKLGPNHEKVFAVVENVDQLVGKILDKIKEVAAAEKDKETHYYFLLTTDHGMTEVKTGVSFNFLTGVPADSMIRLLPGGGIGHVFLDQLPKKERGKVISSLKREVKKHDFAKIYTKKEMPKEWHYDHPTRVGDLVVVLDPGYAFVNNASKVAVPINEVNGPLGMHGYDPHLNPDMFGVMVLWRYPENSGLNEITSPLDSLRLHATVARLLGISPSSHTHEKPINELKLFSPF